MDKTIDYASGVQSSKQPSLELIPAEALWALSERFELGVERKGDKAWNALSANQACLSDRRFAIERIGHAINHLLRIKTALEATVFVVPYCETSAEIRQEAAAVMWAGAYLVCASTSLKP